MKFFDRKYLKFSNYKNRLKLIFGKQSQLELPVELYGQQWKDNDVKVVALFFGFSPWKRQVISELFPEYKSAFVLGKASMRRVEREFISKLPEHYHLKIFCWGNKYPKTFPKNTYFSKSKKKKIQVSRIEDGFLRSIGSGVLHTRPASLCVDDLGIYFDASRPSRLEEIINDPEELSAPELLKEAGVVASLIRSGRLTKYYDPDPYMERLRQNPTGEKTILVIGQVEDDASLLKGKASVASNYDLVKLARKENPNARVLFRPHPDYWSGIRKRIGKERGYKDLCHVVPPSVSLYELFSVSDHVYTITSLSGFEALIYGLKVTTLGAPFYSNWGLTDDRVKLRRRNKSRSIEQLVAAAYLKYPVYIHPKSRRKCSFFDIAGYFIVESLKDNDYFSLSGNKLYCETLSFDKYLGLSFELLARIERSDNYASLNEDDVKDLNESKLIFSEYPHLSHLLIKSANYDLLRLVTGYCLDNILSDVKSSALVDFRELSEFFYALSIALRNSNGRVLGEIPNLIPYVEGKAVRGDNYFDFLKHYITCLSLNIQYDILGHAVKRLEQSLREYEGLELYLDSNRLEEQIRKIGRLNPSPDWLLQVLSIIRQGPSRSERNHQKRQEILVILLGCLKSALSNRYMSFSDAYLNGMLTAIGAGDFESLKLSITNLLALFEVAGDTSDKELSFNERSSLFVILSQRKKHWGIVIDALLKNNAFIFADRLLSKLDFQIFDEAERLRFSFLIARGLGKSKTAQAYLSRLVDEFGDTDRVINLKSRFYREIGQFERSIHEYQRMLALPGTVARKNAIRTEIEKLSFLRNSSRYLNSVSQPKFPKGVIFLASQTCFNTLAMMTPALIQCKKHGYAVVCLTQGMVEHDSTGIEFIDKFQGVIPLNLRPSSRQYDWTVDWENKVISCQGINFYQGFYERLSTYVRRFYVDINVRKVDEQLRNMLDRSDLCLSVCERIYREIVKDNNMPVVFVSGNSHVTPFSIFRDYAINKDDEKLSYVNCNVAYEAYFSNLGSKYANTMCVTDMTLHKDIRAPFMARADQFVPWYEKNRDNPEYMQKADALINVNRVGSDSDASAVQLIEYLKTMKASGKRIVCAFGKVPVDLNVPYDGGPAHSDMADWINHTVSICSELDDVVLLVKPHPHELKPEIALDLVEGFHDLISVQVGDNVKLLDHKEINGHALAPYLDLALLYNGSSGVELTAQGIPVIMTSYFGKHDYPICLNYPESREHYEQMISKKMYRYPDEDLRRQAAFLLCYLGTDEISIENRYSKRQLTNDKIGVPSWRDELMEQFLNEGDPKMEYIAKRIVEKFEGPVMLHGRA
ncbi:hypothetical protein [Marinobacter sp. bablab_jr008]|uniref:capsular polysaccharide export protein, LipB/KpsS family n=1 Tax=Marinobacter sp. bablab_jr008 TaxID=2755064 RepID=UPI0018F17C20|nr:hypothetical protein [Marinobacter sp. bablab_jr008]